MSQFSLFSLQMVVLGESTNIFEHFLILKATVWRIMVRVEKCMCKKDKQAPTKV